QKLLQGLMTATRKRSITMRKLEDIVDAAEALLHQREDREIGTHEIGALVMERLRDIDQVAYVRFASVYRRFDDVEGFQDLLKQLFQAERDASLAGQQSLFEQAASNEPPAANPPAAPAAAGRKQRGAGKEPAGSPP